MSEVGRDAGSMSMSKRTALLEYQMGICRGRLQRLLSEEHARRSNGVEENEDADGALADVG